MNASRTELQGKTALVTGSTSGIGKATAAAQPAAHAATAAAAAAPAKPASSGPVCTTVSFIDADGNKRFTRECK